MTFSLVYFNNIPKARVDGGIVRFFPVVTSTLPVVSYDWNFGDGGTSTDASPKHTYSGASTFTFTVSFHCNDSAGTASSTVTGTVKIAVSGDVPAASVDGSYESIACFVYDDTNSMMVNRDQFSSKLYLMEPMIKDTIDFSTTTTFSFLVPEDASTIERGLIAEGKNVIMLQGNSIVFSGLIRRAAQNTQGAFSPTLPLQMWDVECDTDLYKLSKLNLSASALQISGATIFDTPGNIARLILTPLGSWDWRGEICCNDAIMQYQINPTSLIDLVPSQYEQIMSLQSATNYDLSSYMDYDRYVCNGFNGTTTVTVTGLTASPSLVGYYLFFPNDSDGCKTFGKITSNSANTIVCSSMVVGSGSTPSWVIVAKQPKISFAPNLSSLSAVKTYNVNEDVFEYSDNDDKRKLYTKVITKGKDASGKNISVALAAVHAYDYDKQFYKDSTYITRRSEGSVLKNTCAKTYASVEVCLTGSWNASFGSVDITLSGYSGSFPTGSRVRFSTSGTLPSPLVAGTFYYVVLAIYNVINISSSCSGSTITFTGGSGTHTAWRDYTILAYSSGTSLFNEYEPVSIVSVTTPTRLSDGAQYWVAYSGFVAAQNKGSFSLSREPINIGIPTASTTGSGVVAYSTNDIVNSSGGTICNVWLYGEGYVIPTGTVCALSTPYSTAIAVTTTGSPSVETMSNGVRATKITITKMLYGNNEYSGRGFLLSPRLYVANSAAVGNNQVLIGEEKITITANNNDTTYGNYIDIGTVTNRVTSDTLKCYPHGVGALVARTNRTEASPETGSTYLDYGCRINTVVVETNTTLEQLDTYATALLLGFGAFYRKATAWLSIQDAKINRVGGTPFTYSICANAQTPPAVGDMVSIIESSSGPTSNFQIVAITIKYDEGKMELQLGDYERNIFLAIQKKTAGINQTLT